jgi:hypothetical protein
VDIARVNHEIERRFGGHVARSAEGLSVRAFIRAPTERDAWNEAALLFQPGLVYELPGLNPWQPVSITKIAIRVSAAGEPR